VKTKTVSEIKKLYKRHIPLLFAGVIGGKNR
jgi:hypothetical protein